MAHIRAEDSSGRRAGAPGSGRAGELDRIPGLRAGPRGKAGPEVAMARVVGGDERPAATGVAARRQPGAELVEGIPLVVEAARAMAPLPRIC